MSVDKNNYTYGLIEFFEIKDNSNNNDNNKEIIHDGITGPTFFTGKKRKMNEEKKEKIFDIKKCQKRGRKRNKGNHEVHDIFTLDNIIKGIKALSFRIIIDNFNSNLKEANLKINNCQKNELFKLLPKEIKKTKKEHNIEFFEKKLKDSLSGEKSKKYKKKDNKISNKIQEINNVGNLISINEIDENNKNNKNNDDERHNKILIDNLYKLAEEGNEDAAKFVNFLNMSFYEFWSIAASFIELDNKEDLLLNENIGDIHDYDAKGNNNIIISIINQINNEVNNYLEKKKEKVKKDYKIIFKIVLKDLFFLINNIKGRIISKKIF